MIFFLFLPLFILYSLSFLHSSVLLLYYLLLFYYFENNNINVRLKWRHIFTTILFRLKKNLISCRLRRRKNFVSFLHEAKKQFKEICWMDGDTRIQNCRSNSVYTQNDKMDREKESVMVFFVSVVYAAGEKYIYALNNLANNNYRVQRQTRS